MSTERQQPREVGIRRHGRRWEINFYDQHGRQRFETVRGSLTTARKVRAMRIHQVQSGRFGIAERKHVPTLGEFVEQQWRQEVAIGLATSTRRGYETALKHHLLPAFGSTPLDEITKTNVRTFMTRKGEERRFDYTKGKNTNPDRPTLSEKSVRNMAAVLHSILASAVEDYELLERNPLDGVLRQRRRRRFPARKRPRPHPKVHVLEPDDFKRAVEAITREDVRRAVLFAALTGLRWGEQVALRVEDLNWRRNRIVVTQALYRRVPGAPKTEGSEGEVPICPTARRILHLTPWKQGYIFSRDGVTPIGDGSWVNRCWREAQKAVGVIRPISWHDLRHVFVSLLIAAGKHPKYIADAARHRDAGFTMRVYGHLFDSMPVTPEWWDDLLWPEGCPYVPVAAERLAAGESVGGRVG